MVGIHRFGPSVEEAAAARAFVRGRLREAKCEAPEDDVALLATELVTNAMRHADGTGGRLEVECPDGRTARVAVWDSGGSDLPDRDQIATRGVGGFGLVLVSEIADRWGADRVGDQKRVWFEVSASD